MTDTKKDDNAREIWFATYTAVITGRSALRNYSGSGASLSAERIVDEAIQVANYAIERIRQA